MQFRVILIAIAKMKVDGKGRGLILTQDELKRLFTEGFFTERDRKKADVYAIALCWDLPFDWLSRIGSIGTSDD
ncbi:MAG: hypothetical protein V7K21_10210 [Nostoc sp.]|uniref:hypothetical protein n=1 Tax=Nostoc sp. TaxID=1180 RepID=UPI002FFB9FC6